MARAFLGMGSNLGDRLTHLRCGVDDCPDVIAVSSVWETEPVGGPEQDAYLNLVVELSTDRSPRELLAVCQSLEAGAERVREERWGPRTLDVDVLWHETETATDPDLTVPHPRMWERRFVVAPLGELAPALLVEEGVDPHDPALLGRVVCLGALGLAE